MVAMGIWSFTTRCGLFSFMITVLDMLMGTWPRVYKSICVIGTEAFWGFGSLGIASEHIDISCLLEGMD